MARNLTQANLERFVRQKYDTTGITTFTAFSEDVSPTHTYWHGFITVAATNAKGTAITLPVKKDTIPIIVIATRIGRGWSLSLLRLEHFAFQPD